MINNIPRSPPSRGPTRPDLCFTGRREGIEEDLRAGGNFCDDSGENEGDRGGFLGQGDRQRCRHRTRLLQRRAAPGYQGEINQRTFLLT